jgi:hypothetical protein
MTDIPFSLNTESTGSSSSASSAVGIYSDIASSTNALERVQQEIGEEVLSINFTASD